MANPMFSGVDSGADGFSERLTNTGPGLASSLRWAGTGTQLPLWEKLERLTMPVLVITGGNDVKFSRLGSRLVDAVGGRGSLAVVPESGHAPHLQRPDVVAGLVRAHLSGGAAD
jgi:2-succinyl-6-hydroxy-2,4-cyclohexadiene-1-carboxylate synthase